MSVLPLLFVPKFLSFKNSLDTKKILGRLPFALIGIVFWLFIYIIFSKVLIYFKGIEVFGDILSAKLLSMVFLCFFSLLIMSSIITALSTFYLSRDLELILDKPVDIKKIHSAKAAETFFVSSWMVMSFALPVLIAYGKVYGAGLIYYVSLPVIFIPFLIIPASIGITITHIVARALPAKNARDVIMVIGIIFFLLIFLLFRFLQPEKLLNPESFSTLLEYLTSMGSDSFFMPYYWITHALLPLLTGGRLDSIFYTMVLVSNAAFFVLITSWAGSFLYGGTLNKSLSSKRQGITLPFERIFPSRISRDGLRAALMVKDLKIFLRDNSQWPQLLLLLALVVIYIYNFKALPLGAIPDAAFIVSNFIAFLNLILAGFVLAAIAARFLFPAVSLEGQTFWIIKASPVTMEAFLRSKLISGLIPLILLSEILILASNLILGIHGIMLAVSMVTILLMALAIGGLGVGLGAIYPKFKYSNVASISMGFGGVFFMILALISVMLTVLFEARPFYLYLGAKLMGRTFGTKETIQTAVCFVMIIIVNAACFYLPLRIGIKKLEDMTD